MKKSSLSVIAIRSIAFAAVAIICVAASSFIYPIAAKQDAVEGEAAGVPTPKVFYEFASRRALRKDANRTDARLLKDGDRARVIEISSQARKPPALDPKSSFQLR